MILSLAFDEHYHGKDIIIISFYTNTHMKQRCSSFALVQLESRQYSIPISFVVAKMYSIIYASFLGEAGVYVSIAHNTVIEQHANYFKECFILILRYM